MSSSCSSGSISTKVSAASSLGNSRKSRGRRSAGSSSNRAAISAGLSVTSTSRRVGYFFSSSRETSVSRNSTAGSFMCSFLLFFRCVSRARVTARAAVEKQGETRLVHGGLTRVWQRAGRTQSRRRLRFGGASSHDIAIAAACVHFVTSTSQKQRLMPAFIRVLQNAPLVNPFPIQKGPPKGPFLRRGAAPCRLGRGVAGRGYSTSRKKHLRYSDWGFPSVTGWSRLCILCSTRRSLTPASCAARHSISQKRSGVI